MQELEDGETEEVFVVEDVVAGEEVTALAMQCLDAAGRPVPEGTLGKVRATWIQGTKKMKYDEGGTFNLLNIKVRTAVCRCCCHPLSHIAQCLEFLKEGLCASVWPT